MYKILNIHLFRDWDNMEVNINLQAPCVFCIGQAFRYSPGNAFYVFDQQIYYII